MVTILSTAKTIPFELKEEHAQCYYLSTFSLISLGVTGNGNHSQQ